MSTRIAADAFVGPGVQLGARVTIGPRAVLLGPAAVEDDVWIGPGVVLGTPPEIMTFTQNAAWEGDLAHWGVHVGARTVIRELASIQQGSARATTIGTDCWLLSRSYLAHDVRLGDGVVVSAGACLGGHCDVGPGANLGMGVVAHQRRSIGAGAMVGMSGVVTKDVPPFALVHGNPARLQGVNQRAAHLAGIPEPDVEVLAGLYARGELDAEALPTSLQSAVRAWLATAPAKPLVRLG